MQPRDSKMPVEIMVVDDEPQAVKYFYKAFSDKYDIVTATSADEAERIILSGKHDIGVLITDQRMPGRTGISLLSSIRKQRPDIVRILASAYCDLDSAIQAVNDGEVFRYISKPWDLASLEVDLEQAVTFHIMQQENSILLREKLGAIQRNVLRERINSMATMSVLLANYKNASSTMYDYLKDMLSETAWRPAVKRQWDSMQNADHWQLPVSEAQRHIGLSMQLLDQAIIPSNDDRATSDVVSVVADCAQALKSIHDVMTVNVQHDVDSAMVAADTAVLKGIMSRLLQSMSHWVTPGSTMQVRVRDANGSLGKPGTIVDFEMRSFDAAKAVNDCVLHVPPNQTTPKQSVEFLRASLALGHLGGSISAPPAKNGFKHVQVYLPASTASTGALTTPSDWLHDLNEEFDRWTIGLYDLAS
jgi:two-component system, probable response regulator PhcQ